MYFYHYLNKKVITHVTQVLKILTLLMIFKFFSKEIDNESLKFTVLYLFATIPS